MKDKHSLDPDPNFIGTSLPDFVDYYNQNIPEGFPRASQKALVAFRAAYPSLFSQGESWTIDKHRKRLMDWLASHRDVTVG